MICVKIGVPPSKKKR